VGNKLSDVLQQDVSGSHVTNDPCDVRPEPSVIVNTLSSSGSGEWLAGEPGSDDIHSSTPRVAVEGDKVIPDRA